MRLLLISHEGNQIERALEQPAPLPVQVSALVTVLAIFNQSDMIKCQDIWLPMLLWFSQHDGLARIALHSATVLTLAAVSGKRGPWCWARKQHIWHELTVRAIWHDINCRMFWPRKGLQVASPQRLSFPKVHEDEFRRRLEPGRRKKDKLSGRRGRSSWDFASLGCCLGFWVGVLVVWGFSCLGCGC